MEPDPISELYSELFSKLPPLPPGAEPLPDLPHEHERKIAWNLSRRLAAHLDGTLAAVVPEGQLGAGMDARQRVGSHTKADADADTITLTGWVEITIRRPGPETGEEVATDGDGQEG